MDLRLPDMDGADAARQLGEAARTARIPVVAVSSSLLAGAGDWFLAAGFAGYLEKPISVREFPDQVRGYCAEAERERAGRHADARAGVAIRGTRYPVVLPSVRDPRLHLAAVIVSLQVLGQVAFDFRLSIAQILISVGTCAAAGGRDRRPAAAHARLAGERAPHRQRRRVHPPRARHRARRLVEHERLVDLRRDGRGVAPLQVSDPSPRRARLQSRRTSGSSSASSRSGPTEPSRSTSGGARCRRPSRSRWRSSSSAASSSCRAWACS